MAQQQINLATEGWDSAFNDNVDELNQQLASVLVPRSMMLKSVEHKTYIVRKIEGKGCQDL